MNEVNTADIKMADTKQEIHELIRRRYSPYVFDPERAVSTADLKALFEAASWAANSFNEQPWRYIIATRDDDEAFETMLSCLTEGNQAWAKNASVVGLGIYKTEFSHNDKPNRVALHDLGAAAANLTLEATARGLVVHQMAGIIPERAREVYNVPEGFEIATAIAIGYPGDPDEADNEKFRERDSKSRSRKALNEFLFAGAWGEAALS
jgi:nitroreductase